MWETWVRSQGWEDPLEKEMATHSNILAWKTHRQRSLVGYTPRDHKESDATEWRRWGGLWLPVRERTLITVTQEKHLLFLYFDLFCRFSFLLSPYVIVVDFIGTMESNYVFWDFFLSHMFFFFLIVINLYLYVVLLQFCGIFFCFVFGFLFF